MAGRCWALCLIITAALIGSFAFSVVVKPGSPAQLVSDSADYHNLAVSILTDGSYPSVYRAPAYPALLTAIYSVAGTERLWPVYLVQSLLLASALMLIYKIALSVTENRKTALLSVVLCTLWPPIISSAGDVMTETLAAFLMAACVWLVMRAVERPALRTCVALGLAAGIGSLTKGTLLLFAGIVPLFVALTGRERFRRVLMASIVLLVSILAIAPWTYRNYRVTGAFVPVQTGAGINFFLGNWPDYWRMRYQFGTYPPEVERMIEGKSEIERERIFMRLGWAYIREDPVRAAGIFARKFSYLWLGALGADPRSSGNPIPHIGRFGIPKRAVVYVPLFLVALYGWFSLELSARRRAYPMLALLASWSAAYVAICPVTRQMTPVVFYEIILFAVGIAAAARRLGEARGRAVKRKEDKRVAQRDT